MSISVGFMDMNLVKGVKLGAFVVLWCLETAKLDGVMCFSLEMACNHVMCLGICLRFIECIFVLNSLLL